MIQKEQRTENSTKIREKLALAGTIRWFHWVIVFLSLLLTFGAWYFSKTQLEAKIALQFDREAEQVVALIVERMKKYEDALWSGVALIQTTGGKVGYSTWETFATSLRIEEKYPGINGIGIVNRVKPDQLDAFLRDQRAIRPDYAIHPPHHQTEYWPISYVIPVGPNAKAIGLDMAHETNRYTAGKKARDTGVAQITGAITLVQDAAKTPGFLFYAPFYQGGRYGSVQVRQDRFVGMVYAPFIVNKLMEGVLAQHKRHVGLRMIDQGEVLYDEHSPDNPEFDSHPLFQKEVTIPLYGRDWMFDIRSTQAFRAAALNNQPVIILIGGLIIDGLLLGLFVLLSRGSRKALAYADVAKRELQLILDSAGQGIYGLNVDGKTTFVNPVAAKLLGYDPAELLGKLMHFTVHHSRPDGTPNPLEDCQMYAALRDGSFHHVDDEVLWRKDGSSFPVEYTSTPIRNELGDIEGAVVTFKDITERKKTERQLIAYNHELKTSNQELDDFAYIASHDLKEPLRGIFNYSTILLEDYGSALNEDAHSKCETLVRLSRRMEDLIDSLHYFSRAGRTELAIGPTDLQQILDEILDSLDVRLKECGVMIRIPRPLPTVLCDHVRVGEIFRNLITNAMKYNDKDQKWIEIGYILEGDVAGETFNMNRETQNETDGNAAVSHLHRVANDEPSVFYVRDNGIGIREKHVPNIFRIFKRLHGRDKFGGGTGSGLTITKKLVERHGGSVWVESAYGEGTTFYFTLEKSQRAEGTYGKVMAISEAVIS